MIERRFFDSKRKVKKKKIAITESLTVTRLKKLMRQGKGIILTMFGLQADKFYTRMGQEKLRCIIVYTIQWLTDMCYITDEKTDSFIVAVLLVLGAIFIWVNFTSCFFQSNDKWVYPFDRNIFIFKFYILLLFYIRIFFSLTTTYDIPFLQIHTTIYFLLVSCYITNVNQ